MRAKTLILWYTLFVNPLPAPAVLMSKVHGVWLKALEDISDAGNIEPSVASIKIVSASAKKTVYSRWIGPASGRRASAPFVRYVLNIRICVLCVLNVLNVRAS